MRESEGRYKLPTTPTKRSSKSRRLGLLYNSMQSSDFGGRQKTLNLALDHSFSVIGNKMSDRSGGDCGG